MSINQRKHIRFSLDIPATIVNKYGERQDTVLQRSASVGALRVGKDNIFAGDEFRLEVELPNKNRLPSPARRYIGRDTG
jgi:hypothetical protein